MEELCRFLAGAHRENEPAVLRERQQWVRRWPSKKLPRRWHTPCSQLVMPNAILVIQPYWSAGTWVFDDPAAGLVREPFVCGVPQMIDALLARAGIANARDAGFRLLFSASPFPGHQGRFTRTRAESGGTWYRDDASAAEGWLCPALFKYFESAPEHIYARAEPMG